MPLIKPQIKARDVIAEARKDPYFKLYSVVSNYRMSLEDYIYKLKLRNRRRISKIMDDHYQEYEIPDDLLKQYVKIKSNPKTDLKRKISEILVKWNMPTKQVAIDEIIELIEEEMAATVEERYKKELAIADSRWRRAEIELSKYKD